MPSTSVGAPHGAQSRVVCLAFLFPQGGGEARPTAPSTTTGPQPKQTSHRHTGGGSARRRTRHRQSAWPARASTTPGTPAAPQTLSPARPPTSAAPPGTSTHPFRTAAEHAAGHAVPAHQARSPGSRAERVGRTPWRHRTKPPHRHAKLLLFLLGLQDEVDQPGLIQVAQRPLILAATQELLQDEAHP